MDPSGVRREDGKSLSWPETVMLVPGGNVWLEGSHVFVQVSDVGFPLKLFSLLFEVLFEDASPLFASDVLLKILNSLAVVNA